MPDEFLLPLLILQSAVIVALVVAYLRIKRRVDASTYPPTREAMDAYYEDERQKKINEAQSDVAACRAMELSVGDYAPEVIGSQGIMVLAIHRAMAAKAKVTLRSLGVEA